MINQILWRGVLGFACLVALPKQAGANQDLQGVWAAHVTLPVTLENHIISKMAGSMHLKGRIVRVHQGDAYEDTFFPCGLTFPTFTTIGTGPRRGGSYGIIVPDSLFDEGFFPPSPAYALRPDAPGSYAFTSSPVALVAGTQLANPISDPWPLAEGLQNVDADFDGQSGITILPDHRWGMAPIGLNAFGTWTAKAIWVALRLRFALRLQAQGVDALQGIAVGIGDGIDKSILGGEKVNPDQSRQTLLNASEIHWLQKVYRPRWDTSRPASVVMRRVPASVSCAGIRGMAL